MVRFAAGDEGKFFLANVIELVALLLRTSILPIWAKGVRERLLELCL
jgi:hypothetical protein